MYEIGEDIDFNCPEMENQLLASFGENFLLDAMRVVQTNSFTPLDGPMIHEAMCVIVSMYIRKAKNGELNQNRTYH